MTPITTLPDDPALLKQLIAELQEQLRSSRREGEQLRQKLDELIRQLFGRKSEKIPPGQLTFPFPDREIPSTEVPESPQFPPLSEETLTRKKRRARRRRPSKDLPRRRVEHKLCESERLCPCCTLPMDAIREETSEQLDYRPSQLEVVEHVRFVYACKKGCDEAVKTAPKPPQLIDKGLPGPGLLAHVAVSKFADHTPLYRLEGIYRRQGADIPRSTMCDWIEAISDRVEPLYKYLCGEVLKSDIIATDDTSVLVQDKPRGTHKGYLWVYLGEAEYPWIVYDYTPSRQRAGPQEFLEGYEGFLQADAYSAYDQIYASGKVREVGCWMHARRYFYKASLQKDERALEALAIIRELFLIERSAKSMGPKERLEKRQKDAKPRLEFLGQWVEKLRHNSHVLPKSKMGEAITYVQNQWEALNRYIEDPRLQIDNGRSERALRAVAIGRKNWLFAGSDAGGKRAARIYTLIASCKRHKIDPFHYLQDLFERLPTHPVEQVHELTPLAWAKRLQETKTKRTG